MQVEIEILTNKQIYRRILCFGPYGTQVVAR